jgi:zinc transport system ATP-binding protein
MILDEPASGLDVEAQYTLYTILHSLNVRGLTVIMITHDLSAVLTHINRLACIENCGLVVHQHSADEGYDPLAEARRHHIVH